MKIGVIAGAGALPIILTQELTHAGIQTLVINITRSADDRLKSIASEFYLISAGQVKKIIETLADNDVKEVIIAGAVSKNLLFRQWHLDTKAIKILSKLKDKRDISIFKAVAEEFESAGIKLVDQRLYLNKLLPNKGVITKHHPSKTEWQDIEFGMDLARKIATLGIGQTVVVKGRIPLAIEAIEGTDETIRRGGRLCKGGAVVVKAAAETQDFRFDVPTVGPDTITTLIESKAAVLAIESGKAFLLDAENVISRADSAKISLVVV